MILTPFIIVIVWSTKHESIVFTKAVLCTSFIVSNMKLVVVSLTLYFEILVDGVNTVPFKIPQVDTQFIVTLICQQEDIVISEPKFSDYITESIFVSFNSG